MGTADPREVKVRGMFGTFQELAWLDSRNNWTKQIKVSQEAPVHADMGQGTLRLDYSTLSACSGNKQRSRAWCKAAEGKTENGMTVKKKGAGTIKIAFDA